MSVIYVDKEDWINLSDTKQSIKIYKATNKDGKYDRALKKETRYFDHLLSELPVANDNMVADVVAA